MGNKHSNYERLLKTPEWREYRKNIFERDNYTCQNCHQKKSADELRVHHKKYIEGITELCTGMIATHGWDNTIKIWSF